MRNLIKKNRHMRSQEILEQKIFQQELGFSVIFFRLLIFSLKKEKLCVNRFWGSKPFIG